MNIEWAPEDALPNMLCISSLGQPPGCELLENVSVARGNVVLIDYGRTIDPESFTVPEGDGGASRLHGNWRAK